MMLLCHCYKYIAVVVGQLLVGLVDDGRRVERRRGAVPVALAPGEPPEFVVDERQHLAERTLVAVAGERQELGDVVGHRETRANERVRYGRAADGAPGGSGNFLETA